MFLVCPSFKGKFFTTHLSIIFLVFCTVSNGSTKEQDPRTTIMLRAFSFNHVGGFSSSALCPENTFINGARVRLSNHLNQTTPTMNSIEFICFDGIHTHVRADTALLLQKNIGTWSDWKKCPNGGFVAGITMFMQSVSTENMVAEEKAEDEKNNAPIYGQFFDVFELGRSRYISGISLNCSLNSNDDNDMDSWNENGSALPAWKNSVVLGTPSGIGLRLYCKDKRLIAGLTVLAEALMTYDQGERWIPLDVTCKCNPLINPARYCYPELEWESLENITCTKPPSGTESQAIGNVSCAVSHKIGLTLNEAIDNLNAILEAFESIDLNRKSTKAFIVLTLASPMFIHDWHSKYNLDMEDYKMAVEERSVDTYLGVKQDKYQANFKNVNYDEPVYCKSIRKKNESLKSEFSVKQLMGYCSIYKLYFPLFKSQFQLYFERKIDGIDSRIIFPTDDGTTASDILESKFKLLAEADAISATNI